MISYLDTPHMGSLRIGGYENLYRVLMPFKMP